MLRKKLLPHAITYITLYFYVDFSIFGKYSGLITVDSAYKDNLLGKYVDQCDTL